MADVSVVHGGTVMASSDVVGSSANLSSADHDFSKVTTNLPTMTVPSTTVTPGWAIIVPSLVPLLGRRLVVTSRAEEFTDLRVGFCYLVDVLRTSNLATFLNICTRWLCLDERHLLLVSQVLHLDRQQCKLGDRHEAFFLVPVQDVLLP